MANFAPAQGVVGVVAHQGRHVERHGEPRLALRRGELVAAASFPGPAGWTHRPHVGGQRIRVQPAVPVISKKAPHWSIALDRTPRILARALRHQGDDLLLEALPPALLKTTALAGKGPVAFDRLPDRPDTLFLNRGGEQDGW